MQTINSLTNTGFGKKAIILGNGSSINLIHKGKLQNLIEQGFVIFGINNRIISNIKYNYMVYYDKDMQEEFEKNKSDYKLIGFKYSSINHCSSNCDYYYGLDDLMFGDSGFHALQIASQIMRFDEIYIVGYDYTCDKDSYHWNESESNRFKLISFLQHSNLVLQYYYKIKWYGKIYNNYEQSVLMAFEYKKIV